MGKTGQWKGSNFTMPIENGGDVSKPACAELAGS